MSTGPAVRALPKLLVLGVACCVACGDHHGPNEPEPFPGISIENALAFEAADSTAIATGATPYACCGLYDPSFVNERALRLILYDPANQAAGWQILILIDRAVAGDTTSLPTMVVAPSKVPRVSMFVTTLNGEWNSDAEESSGSIVVHSFQCTFSTIRVDFSVDAVLGSELAGPTIRVKGTFRATLPAQSCT
jgi:hypothetical protein